ncbi:MAG: heparinase II/III domain-containing protein [Candidatus Cyclobacteriaceae bacterium M3_2C_046]
MKKLRCFLLLVMVFIQLIVYDPSKAEVFTQGLEKGKNLPKLDNPMSVTYLQKNLQKESPRLVLNRKLESKLKKSIKNDPVVANVYQAIRLNARQIMSEPFLERKMEGRRLLSVSREMLYRINMLGMVYLIDKDQEVLERINNELLAVCRFADWNPSHFLDVAEMALAVALAIDWTKGDLPPSTETLAKESLIHKAIEPSYNEKGNTGWVNGTNNWNQVCHAGMIAAAIATAEKAPELAAKTISRALDGIPHALAEYSPDGVYPEGSTYWSYGTSFTAISSAILESAFNTDFDIAKYPALEESALFRVLSIAPSGRYYNFADCGDQRSKNGDFTLAWFAAKTGNEAYYEKDRFLLPPTEMGKLSRLAGAGLVWVSQFEPIDNEKLPLAWKGDGSNPVVIFRGGKDDPRNFYFGAKGGRGTVNHGNMDGGSFIFELDGVRWVVDPGNQSYHELEKTGFELWGKCQDCQRWTLLTKNNYGHSTLTVNDDLHQVNGLAYFYAFDSGSHPTASLDLSAAFGPQLKKAQRKFVKESSQAVLIEDYLELSQSTQQITWQLMTTAKVALTANGAILSKDGKKLYIENLSHPDLTFSVISLDPPPLSLDRRIKGLKRIELRIPAYLFEKGTGNIKVRLTGEE